MTNRLWRFRVPAFGVVAPRPRVHYARVYPRGCDRRRPRARGRWTTSRRFCTVSCRLLWTRCQLDRLKFVPRLWRAAKAAPAAIDVVRAFRGRCVTITSERWTDCSFAEWPQSSGWGWSPLPSTLRLVLLLIRLTVAARTPWPQITTLCPRRRLQPSSTIVAVCTAVDRSAHTSASTVSILSASLTLGVIQTGPTRIRLFTSALVHPSSCKAAWIRGGRN